MKNILLILLIVLTLVGCEDECEKNPDPSCPWLLTKVSVNSSELNKSVYKLQFDGDGTFLIQAPDIDDPDFPESGTWVLNSSRTIITLNGSVDLDVIINKGEFIVEYTYDNYKSGPVTFRFEQIPA